MIGNILFSLLTKSLHLFLGLRCYEGMEGSSSISLFHYTRCFFYFKTNQLLQLN